MKKIITMLVDDRYNKITKRLINIEIVRHIADSKGCNIVRLGVLEVVPKIGYRKRKQQRMKREKK